MRKKTLTTYLTIFLATCLILVFLLIGLFSDKSWWNNWMAMVPMVYMILGALYSNLMIKNCETEPVKLTWIYVYKGIKLAVTVIIVVLYLIFADKGKKAFLIITMISYLVALTEETWIHSRFLKQSNPDKKKAANHNRHQNKDNR